MNSTAEKLREAADYMASCGANSAHAIATVRRLFDAPPSVTFGGDLGRVLDIIADELDELQARAAEANCLRQQLESAEDKAERRKKHIGYLDTALHDKNVLFEQRGEALAKVTEENAELRKQAPSERERQILAMLPRFEDGEPVMLGDKVHYASTHNDETAIEVESITAMDGYFVLCDDEYRSNQYEQGQRVKRPAQSVLDADGVEIKVGDTVHEVGTGREFTVERLPNPDAYQGVMLRHPNGGSTSLDSSRLTHIAPDSWERLEEDAQKNECDYFGAKDGDNCYTCIAGGCTTGCTRIKSLDIVRRAKALAGVEVAE